MELMRRYLFEEINGRNLLRPEVSWFLNYEAESYTGLGLPVADPLFPLGKGQTSRRRGQQTANVCDGFYSPKVESITNSPLMNVEMLCIRKKYFFAEYDNRVLLLNSLPHTLKASRRKK